MINKYKQAGLTLIEMMIAMVLGLFVIAVIITVFSTNVRSSTESIKMIRLNQELRGVMTMMVDELKRHGYSSSFPTTSTFMNDLNIDSTCIRYSYDEINRDPSGSEVDGAQDTDERFGFKLENNIVMWTRSGGDVGATKGIPDCDNGAWEPLTIVNIASITALDFNYTGSTNSQDISGEPALTTSSGTSAYEVTITLTGTTDLPHSSPANDPSRTIIETIRLRNDHPKD